MSETITLTVYTVDELKDEFPDGYARALKDHQDREVEYTWIDEIHDSMIAVAKILGFEESEVDYSYGAYCPSYVRSAADGHTALDLYNAVRRCRKITNSDGSDWPTGYCADHAFAERVVRSYDEGERDASMILRRFSDVAQLALEDDIEHEKSEGNFLDLHGDDTYFLPDGRIHE